MTKIFKKEKNGEWRDAVDNGFRLTCYLQQLDLDNGFYHYLLADLFTLEQINFDLCLNLADT